MPGRTEEVQDAPEKLPGWSYMFRYVSTPDPATVYPDLGGTFTTIVNGRLAASVSLKGTLGQGRRMVLDDADWRRVERVLGADWGLRELVNGGLYVVSRRKASAGPGLPPTPVLARYLARAVASQVVAYRNGDTLDLTRPNLVVVDRREFMRAWGSRGEA